MNTKRHIYFYRNLNNEFVKTDQNCIYKKILFRTQSGDKVYCLNHHHWEEYKECSTNGFTTINDEHYEGFVVNYCSAKYIWESLDSYDVDLSYKIKDENGIQFTVVFFDIHSSPENNKVELIMYYIGRKKYSEDTGEWFEDVKLKKRVLEYNPCGEHDFKYFKNNIDTIPKNVLAEFINQIGGIYNMYNNSSIDVKGKGLDFIEELHLLPLSKVSFYPVAKNTIFVSKDKNLQSDENKKIYRTIQEAIDNALDDDTIVIFDDGYYYEDLIINKRITIMSDCETVKIIPKTDAGIRIEGDCYLERLIFTNEIPSYMTEKSEVIKTNKEKKSPLIFIKDSKPKLKKCTIYKSDGIGIYIENAAPEIDNCDIARSTDSNIYITGKSVAEISFCTLGYSKEACGIEITGDAKLRIEGCEIFHNNSSGIKAMENSSGKIITTTIMDNKEYGIEDHSEGYFTDYSYNMPYWNGKEMYRDFYNNPL